MKAVSCQRNVRKVENVSGDRRVERVRGVGGWVIVSTVGVSL